MGKYATACAPLLFGLVIYSCGGDDGATDRDGIAGAGEAGQDNGDGLGGSKGAAEGGSAGVAGAESAGAAGEAGGAAGSAGGSAGSPSGGASGGAGAGAGAGGMGGDGSSCDLGEVASTGTQDNLDLFGTVIYFADGAALPAGRYRATYVDGCMKYGGGQDWTIHAYAAAEPFGWWFVGETTADKIVAPPGTVGYAASNGAFATFAECVAANLALSPLEFDFAGGKLGVWLQDSPYSDNMAGEDARNPKWQLTLLAPCEE
jgi:hypothetical protein